MLLQLLVFLMLDMSNNMTCVKRHELFSFHRDLLDPRARIVLVGEDHVAEAQGLLRRGGTRSRFDPLGVLRTEVKRFLRFCTFVSF